MRRKFKFKLFTRILRPFVSTVLNQRNVNSRRLIWQKKQRRVAAVRQQLRATQIAKIEQHFHATHLVFAQLQLDHVSKIFHNHPTSYSKLLLRLINEPSAVRIRSFSLYQHVPYVRNSQATVDKSLHHHTAVSSNNRGYTISRRTRLDDVSTSRTKTKGTLTTLGSFSKRAIALIHSSPEAQSERHYSFAKAHATKPTKFFVPEQLPLNAKLAKHSPSKSATAPASNNIRQAQPVEIIYRNDVGKMRITPSNSDDRLPREQQPDHTSGQTTHSAAASRSQNNGFSGALPLSTSEAVVLHEQVVRNVLANKTVTNQLADQVMQRIEQKIKIERQRRGQ